MDYLTRRGSIYHFRHDLSVNVKVYFCFQSIDVDKKLHHSGKFFIKLHSTTGSKLTKYYLTYDEGKIRYSAGLKHTVRSTRYAVYVFYQFSETSQVVVECKKDDGVEYQLWSFANNKIRCCANERYNYNQVDFFELGKILSI